ncbi:MULTISPECIES: YceI family protein [Catellatospora]|uniref:Polyisoprenoid-binding protein n=2 Tax=Catellatospora TaxID=53365 RepID=A0A8J3KQZ5_9ACTN|nr:MULTISPECIES: YceI family protein [Catellatospora]RKE11680.1 polyisoprenoid-binding protein YceI [Catellatospora citrea]GIF90898.1 polyisoprenoid-binding protein [Catellatospora chokoriensis]GIF99729.1 polyisoprenoid-binding protein [Catellatospora citrea]
MTTLSTRTWNGLTIPTPGTYAIDPAHTRVGFVVKHMVVSKVRGSFKDVAGEIVIAEDPLASSVNAVVQTASIDTGVADRDNHLRTGDFLEVEKFPELTFRSTGLRAKSGEDFTLVGELTIKDVTKTVELALEFGGVNKNPWGQEIIGFTATTEIDREDYNITWNQALETGGVLVGKSLKIEIEGEATRQA